MKLLILLLIGYLIYRGVKNRTAKPSVHQQAAERRAAGEIDDIMVKDPSCGVYFPQKDGIHLRHAGEDLYFCSEACRDAFVDRIASSGRT
jgi:YHS domain-containing protein